MNGKTELLSILKACPPDAEKVQDYFNDLAKLLMDGYVIVKGDIEYEIVEIEFYLFSKDHPDIITYPRKMSAGKWFFHQSGVDLTFESDEKHYGGILIRGIKRMTPRFGGHECSLLILGPQKCVDELWDNFDAFEVKADEYPIIVRAKESKDMKINNYPRWIPLDKKSVEKVGVDETRRLKVKKVIDNNLKSIKDIDEKEAREIMFDHKYRFIKESSIEKDSPEWKKYKSKPPMI